MNDRNLHAAIEAYNDVWQRSGNITASNVEEVRRTAMRAALKAAALATEAKPAAYIISNQHGETLSYVGATNDMKAAGYREIPLYAVNEAK